MRDVARSLWHESGSDLSVAEFCMGHSIAKMGYDKIMTLSPDYAVKAFLKAEPFLSLLESGRTVAETHKRDQVVQEAIERIRKLEERLAQLRGS
jgi:hypothetical protein